MHTRTTRPARTHTQRMSRYRGYCGRVYVFSYHKVRSAACVRVQSYWRGYSARKWTTEFRATCLAAVAILQLTISKFLLRQRLAFAAKHRGAATLMQQVGWSSAGVMF